MTIINFLHITDFHYDPYFSPSVNSNQFCHSFTKEYDNDTTFYYGRAGSECDSPGILINETFSYLKSEFSDVDFILWTGDSGRHDRDKQLPHPIEELRNQVQFVVNHFKNTFNIPILPTIGNWDTESKNNANSNDYINLFELWQPLWNEIESDKIKTTFLTGGYYTWQHNSGLKFVSLNTLSWFSESETNDCGQDQLSQGDLQLEWLNLVLIESRMNSKQVIIIGHVPPLGHYGEPLYSQRCLVQYLNLVSTFSDVIITQYFGHVNKDTVYILSSKDVVIPVSSEIMYEKELSKVDFKSVFFTGPSITPHYYPSFRLGKIINNGSTFTLQSHTQYYFDTNGPFNYRKSCETLNWQLPDLTPQSWKSYFARIYQKPSLGYDYKDCIHSHLPRNGFTKKLTLDFQTNLGFLIFPILLSCLLFISMRRTKPNLSFNKGLR